MKFYLGTNKANWMKTANVPLFISHRTLRNIRHPRPSRVEWCLDSGGFTELSLHGQWTISPDEYAWKAFVYMTNHGKMTWASQQDWMVEEFMLERTGKSIAEHQSLTTQNFLDLKKIEPKVPFIPVIQGQSVDDYFAHIGQFKDAGVDLVEESTVGIGSVCRRQSTNDIVEIVTEITKYGLRLHGFGMKTLGLKKIGHLMKSADSMAWSFAARRQNLRLPECTHRAQRCSDCLVYAERWTSNLLQKVSAQS
jgi:hypothetical protein